MISTLAARTSQRNCRWFQISSQTNRLQFDIARFDHLDLCCLVQPPCLFTSPPMLLDIVVVDARELRNICTLLHQRGYLTSTKTKGGKRLAPCSGSSLAWAAARSLLRNGILGGTVPSNGSLLSVACARNHIAWKKYSFIKQCFIFLRGKICKNEVAQENYRLGTTSVPCVPL